MLAGIKNFFDSYLQGSPNQNGASLDHRLKVATVALLLETARADFSVLHQELTDIARHAQQYFDLTEKETSQLISLAEEETSNATSYYEFTSLINQSYSQQEKRSIIEMMWRVAYADRELEKYEEALVRKIADLLHVPHAAFIAAKNKVLKELGIE